MMLIGCGQITWRGVDEPEILGDIREAGYDGAPPKLQPGRSAPDTLELYRSYGLRPAPAYLGAPLWLAERRQEIVEAARQGARLCRELGCEEIYIAAGGEYQAASGRTRREVAGHVGPDDGLSEGQLRTFADTLAMVGEATRGQGVRSCFHNHVGTVIETEDEIERLLALSDPELVFLGPDTGHLAWGGVDPVEFCRRHRDRIRTMHLKDIDEDVRSRGCAEGWDYGTFSDNGIFAELGEGGVDFPALFSLLDDGGFDGWLVVETDVTRKPTALESATVSRRYLRSLGR